jgi:hypothetical protein
MDGDILSRIKIKFNLNSSLLRIDDFSPSSKIGTCLSYVFSLILPLIQ